MKQKILILYIFIIALVIATIFGLNSYVYSANEVNRTKIVLNRDTEKDNIVHTYIDVFEKESIASFQISLNINTAKPEDINNITVNWNDTISKNAILYRADYNKDTRKLNLYVVSKEELTTVNLDGNVVLNIGDIVIDTKNTQNMQVEINPVENSIKTVSINHNSKVITVDNNTDKIMIDISKKVDQDPNPTPDPDPSPTPDPDPTPTPDPDPNPEDKPNPTPGENNNTINPGENTNTTEPNTNGIISGTNTAQPNTNNTQKDNQATGKLAYAGISSIFSNPVVVIIIIIALCLIISVIYIKLKNKKSMNIYK